MVVQSYPDTFKDGYLAHVIPHVAGAEVHATVSIFFVRNKLIILLSRLIFIPKKPSTVPSRYWKICR